MPERQFGSFDSPFSIVITAPTNCPFGDAAASRKPFMQLNFKNIPQVLLKQSSCLHVACKDTDLSKLS